jgi:hypothetical protein
MRVVVSDEVEVEAEAERGCLEGKESVNKKVPFGFS